MAVNTTDKAMNEASKLISASDSLLKALESLVNLKKEHDQSGIDFTDTAFQAALATSANKHVDASMLNGVVENIGVLDTYFVNNFYYQLYQKLRP